MRIKNTRELRLRANAHARLDHVKQRTYGQAKVNGQAEYKGCAVGCLSTPHRKPDLIAFLRSKVHGALSFGGWVAFDGSGNPQRDALARDFGICAALAVVAEGFFEAQPKHGAAIEFIRDFAHALPEGADVRPDDVRAWLKAQRIVILTRGASFTGPTSSRARFGVQTISYLDVMRGAKGAGKGRVADRVGANTAAFLTWLRDGAPRPRHRAVTEG